MTKKDYELIACALASVFSAKDKCGVLYNTLVNQFARILSHNNPRFDAAKFKEACGVPQ